MLSVFQKYLFDKPYYHFYHIDIAILFCHFAIFQGRIQTVIDDGEKAVQYYYNNDSTLQKICYGNGVTTEYGYDKDQSVVSLMTAKKDGTYVVVPLLLVCSSVLP